MPKHQKTGITIDLQDLEVFEAGHHFQLNSIDPNNQVYHLYLRQLRERLNQYRLRLEKKDARSAGR